MAQELVVSIIFLLSCVVFFFVLCLRLFAAGSSLRAWLWRVEGTIATVVRRLATTRDTQALNLLFLASALAK